jgi:ABC-type antimicrobial peptide transport system permease subunit
MKRGYGDTPVELIGVIRDTAGHVPFDPMPAQLYLPLPQSYATEMRLHLRTIGNPEQLIAAVQTVNELDRHLPVYEVKHLAWQLDNALTPQRMAALLISSFGLLALALAAIDLYGVMSYTVAQRAQEIGLRMALGARAGDVIRLILRRGIILTLSGVAIGLAASLALTRLMSGLLFGVSPTDPLTFALMAALLTLVALLACYLPARRATKVDPMIALRCE